MAMESNIEDHRLEVTVIACDPVRVARNGPLYACLEYAGSMIINIPTTDLGLDHNSLSDKSFFTIIQGQRSIKFVVFKKIDFGSKKIDHGTAYSEFVGSGEILLDDVLSLGHHDSSWSFRKGKNKRAGELRVILHYPNANPNEVRPSSSTTRNLPPPPSSVPSHALPFSPYPPTPSPYNHHLPAHQYPPAPSPYNYHLPAHQYPPSPSPYNYHLPAHQYPPTPSPYNYHLPSHQYPQGPPPGNYHLPPLQYPPAYSPNLHPPPTPPSNHVLGATIMQAAALAQMVSVLFGFFGS